MTINRIIGYGSSEPRATPPFGEEPSTSARQRMARLTRSLNSSLAEHPAVGLGAAFTVGVFLGWVIKRR
jgi:hypothetical protein